MDSTVNRSTAPRLSFEEKLEPKLKDAEYLLVLVLAFMLWTAGFVDMFTHASQDRQIFGMYSIPYFLLLVLYSLGFVFWSWLIFPARSIDRFKLGLRAVQNNTWLGLLVFAGIGGLLGSMYLVERWVMFPLLMSAMAILALLMGGVILWARPDGKVAVMPWRKIIGWAVISFVLVEVLLQGLAFLKVLPLDNMSGMFTPYGRVYQSQQGYTNARTNRLGWYYPNFALADDSYRIVFTGDRYLQGLEVKPEQNLGVGVHERLNSDDSSLREANAEVITYGIPGYGPGLYLDRLLIPYVIDPVAPAEVVVFFHLADDFQAASQPGGPIPYYQFDEAGEVSPHPDDLWLRHDLQHIIIRGYEPINPVRIASTHLFLFNLFDSGLRGVLGERQHVPVPLGNSAFASTEAPFGRATFVYNPSPESEHAQQIALGLLEQYRLALAERGIDMRLVTIPYFPAQFYQQYSGNQWSTQLDGADLLYPEATLGSYAAAAGVPFLSLGAYFEGAGYTVDEIRSFFFNDGSGHFTPEGHAAAAQAVFDCFYRSGAACPVD